jgi:predicted DNA-binding protein (MmcQ/YjbR family)
MDPFAVRSLVREFALGLPGAYEEFPWGESVAKVNKKVFVFLGHNDAETAGYSVKLKNPSAHAHAMAVPGAGPNGYGLGKAGWVSVRSGRGAPSPELLCEWVEESYRVVAPKRRVAELNALRK